MDYGINGHGINWEGERVEWHIADAVGAALIRENIASVQYRYGDHLHGLPGPVPTPEPDAYEHQVFRTVEPAQVLKALDCYEYQACEHPAWRESEAARFCDVLRRRYAAMMPGYDDAL